MKEGKNFINRGTTNAGQKGDWWSQGAKKYSGSHGSKATGGPWPESPGQGGPSVEDAKKVSGSIKGSNKVAP